MSNRNKTLYTGMSKNLPERISQHKHKVIDGFTKTYNCTKCVYYEFCEDTWSARIREKQIKNLKRIEKIKLVESKNPSFVDLSKELMN